VGQLRRGARERKGPRVVAFLFDQARRVPETSRRPIEIAVSFERECGSKGDVDVIRVRWFGEG
jgi:hypothetical protein